MSLTEKLLFGVFSFQALVLVAWAIYLRRELQQERRKKLD